VGLQQISIRQKHSTFYYDAMQMKAAMAHSSLSADMPFC
jgi:hypothetical protein